MSKPPLNLVGQYRDQDVQGWWMSEKLDGVRGYWNGRTLYTRQGNQIHPPSWWTAHLPKGTALDGELYMGRGTFDEVSGVVRQDDAGDAAWRRVRYHIFDLPKHKGSTEDRHAEVTKIVKRSKAKGSKSPMRTVPRKRVKDAEHRQRELKRVLKLGGEGLVLHKPGAKYRAGSRSDLLKLKGEHDEEAVVLRRIEGTGKHAGRMGALEVEDAKNGEIYRVGTGFTDDQRDRAASLFPNGTVITVTYTERTKSGKPRFPRFLRVRDDEPRTNPRHHNPEPTAAVKRRVLEW